MRILLRVLPAVLLAAFAAPSSARIISYAPVTDQFGRPAVQLRENRHYLLFETPIAFQPPSQISAPMPQPPILGNVVVHDRLGEDEPQVLLPPRAQGYRVDVLAMQVGATGARRILIGTDFDPQTGGVSPVLRYLFSPNGGSTWQLLALGAGSRIPDFYRSDVGGPVVRGRGAQIRIGNDATPFVFTTQELVSSRVVSTRMYALDANGSLRLLATFEPQSSAMLLGENRERNQFLVAGRPLTPTATLPNGIRVLQNDGQLRDLFISDAVHPYMDGWISSSGAAYLNVQRPGAPQKISYIAGGTESVLVTVAPQNGANPLIFAVPMADFDGAWMIRRMASQPTALLSHRAPGEVAEEWRDLTAPEIEALHPARSSARLLIQVNRPRTTPVRLLVDPALAVWEVGTPAPARYDELFLNEGPAKGFISLDVDAAANGAPFVFDSAPVMPLPPPPISGGGGGGDIVQEWGIVRSSLHQKIVIPALARLRGGYLSFWKSDLILQNPDQRPLRVALRFADSSTHQKHEREISLAPREIRYFADALLALFTIEQGGGALFLTPEPGRSVLATSRTYNDTGFGTYGMSAGANDVYAASGSRFFLTYAGAFQGPETRTNLLVTDPGTRGARFGMRASSPTGVVGRSDLEFDVPAGGQIQINNLSGSLGLGDQRAALKYETRSGQSIASLVSIDNRTNDPTLFPPDVAAGTPRMIPVIGHLDGGHGARFRTDLFLFNPTDRVRSVLLQTRPLDLSAPDATVSILLLPYESKVILDVYRTLFNRTGTGRLVFQSGTLADTNGIRVAARIYSEREDGGTYGYVMPALNAFQVAGPGESIEILGSLIDPRFRTNLALVDSGFVGPGSQRVRVEVFGSGAQRLDSFEVQVPTGGGMQLTDLFTARSLVANSPTPVLIKVTPAAGQIAAFATTIDNRTNDSTYLGAGLSAQD